MAADVTEPEPRAQPRKVRFSWRRFLVFLLLVALVLIIGRFTDSVVAELIFVVAALAILVGLTVSDIIKRRSSDRAGGDGPLFVPGPYGGSASADGGSDGGGDSSPSDFGGGDFGGGDFGGGGN
ncbi:MAG: hypothetical protein M3174_05255 [Actinomycetota bacterium]|nr:hypothetical protein [Actinomycetota bacterium]